MADNIFTAGQVVKKTVSIKAPPLKIWEVLTRPELIKRWISETETEILTDWAVGGPVLIRGDLHGIKYENKGTVLQAEPGKALRYSYWSNLLKLPDSPENYMVVEFIIAAEENQSTLTLIQSNLTTEAIYRHADLYWNITLGIIKRLLEN